MLTAPRACAVLNLQRAYAQYEQAGLWTEVGALFTPDGSFVFDGLIKPEQTSRAPVAIAGFLRTRYGGDHEGLKADGLSTMMIDASASSNRAPARRSGRPATSTAPPSWRARITTATRWRTASGGSGT
jgi:hypothetical protein